MTTVLVTGFEPFGGESVNPSWEAALRLARESHPGMTLHARLLPVERYRAVDLALAALEETGADAVLALGQAGGRARITPERIAINIDDFRTADNAGVSVRDAAHHDDGPDAYLCTLPVRAIVEAMQAAGIPAAVSNTAGTFICNHLAYGLLHAIRSRRLPVIAGFVHLPYLPEQAATKVLETPSMSLETVLAGLRAALPAVALAAERQAVGVRR